MNVSQNQSPNRACHLVEAVDERISRLVYDTQRRRRRGLDRLPYRTLPRPYIGGPQPFTKEEFWALTRDLLIAQDAIDRARRTPGREGPDPLTSLLDLAINVVWRVRGAVTDDACHLFGIPPFSDELDDPRRQWQTERVALAAEVRAWPIPPANAAPSQPTDSDPHTTHPSDHAGEAAESRASSDDENLTDEES